MDSYDIWTMRESMFLEINFSLLQSTFSISAFKYALKTIYGGYI